MMYHVNLKFSTIIVLLFSKALAAAPPVDASLDTSCNFALIPEIATELIKRMSKFPTDDYDVQSNVKVVSHAYQPIPLFSRYLAFEQQQDSKTILSPPPTFIHYSNVTIEEAVEAYCLNNFNDPSSAASKSQCIEVLLNTANDGNNVNYRNQNKKAISKSLESFKHNRLPAGIDFADVAAGRLFLAFTCFYISI